MEYPDLSGRVIVRARPAVTVDLDAMKKLRDAALRVKEGA